MPNNFVYALQPFWTTPSISFVSSQHPDFPGTNMLLDDRPFYVWRTLNSSGPVFEFDFGANISLSGVFINNINFTQLTIKKRPSGGTDENCAPNLLANSEGLLTNAGTSIFSPWAQYTPTVTVVGFKDPAPYRRMHGQEVSFGTAPNGVIQDVDILGAANSVAGRNFSGHVWLRTPTGTPTGTIALEISTPTNTFISSTTVEVTTTWTRIPFFMTLSASATGTVVRFRIMRKTSNDLPGIVFGGAQLAVDFTAPPQFDFKTQGASQITIFTDPKNGRKKVFIPLAFSTRILRFTASGLASTTNSTAYEVGGVSFLPSIQQFGGYSQFPFTITTDDLGSSASPPSGIRRLRNFSRRTVLSFGGTYIAAQDYAALMSIARQGPAEPFVFCDGLREPGGPIGTNDPCAAHLVRLRSDINVRHDTPEVLTSGFELEEVI